jgi:regulator of sigma E protease
MPSALVTVLSFLVTVGLLVVVHEWGHYAVARLAGVKILRFSVGFGRTLWMRRSGPDRTEWVIAAFPLGGFVKMLDSREVVDEERAGNGETLRHDLSRAFDLQPVGKRIAIVLAGPAANFLAAFLLYWVLFVTGLPGVKPVVGDPPRGTAAAAAGLANGDTIRAVGGDPTATWTDVRWLLLKEAVRGGAVALEIEHDGGGSSTRSLDLGALTKEDLDRDFLRKLGLKNYTPRAPAVLGRILPDGAGARAGLHAGDRIVSVAGEPVATWGQFTARVRAAPGRSVTLVVERDGKRLEIRATPEAKGEGEARIGLLKVEPGDVVRAEWDRMTTTVRYGALEAVPKAVARVWDLSAFSLRMLFKMLLGEVSWKNLSGPLTIADYAGQSAQLGWVSFAGFLALVSVSLGVLNLLPIPLLDGGHLVYYSAEIVKGSPVSERTLEIGQRVGLAILAGLTFFAFYNDINRLLTG